MIVLIGVFFTFIAPIIGSVVLFIDLNNVLSTKDGYSIIQQISLNNQKLSIKFLYLMRFIFFIFTTMVAFFLWFNVIRELFTNWLPERLKIEKCSNQDEKYMINVFKTLRQHNEELLEKFIYYDKENHRYHLVGFFSSLEPVRIFNSFYEETFSDTFKKILLATWITSTGIIGYLTHSSIVNARNAELSVTEEIHLLYLLGINTPIVLFLAYGLIFALIFLSSILKRLMDFRIFVKELIEKQEEKLSQLILQSELKPSKDNYVIMEKEKLCLNEMKLNIDLFHLLTGKAIPIVIPIVSTILTVFTSLPSLIS